MVRCPRLVVVVCLALSTTSLGVDAASASTKHVGVVNVLYAGSLSDFMNQRLAPAFTKATGYRVVGVANGSSALASEIKAGTQVGDVFLSASPSSDRALEGAANGKWVTSFANFASSPLVLAYNTHSPFASALATRPWYDVVTRAGFLLGRTDPATDPKGVLAVRALRVAATRFHLPQLAQIAQSHAGVFEETALVGELQAGQLDAGFFYEVEARSAHLPTRPLSGTNLAGHYTVALLKNAPHLAAARAFRAFLTSPQGRNLLGDAGLTPAPSS